MHGTGLGSFRSETKLKYRRHVSAALIPDRKTEARSTPSSSLHRGIGIDVCSASRYTIFLMVRSQNGAPPVGRYIRQQIIPAGMSVTKAARRTGRGPAGAVESRERPRGVVAETWLFGWRPRFGADRARLLELQAASDRDRRSVEDRAVAVGTYAPSFLTIKARQIEEWAAVGRIQARDRLPVLLRRLIHASGRELRDVDFPGYDNAQRHGWDGRVKADAATLWVPEGRSFWELSVNQRPKVKADEDYRTPPEGAVARGEGEVYFHVRNAAQLAGKGTRGSAARRSLATGGR